MAKNDFKGLYVRARGNGRWLLCVDLGRDLTNGQRREATQIFEGSRIEAGRALIDFASRTRKRPIKADLKMTLNQLIEMTLATADIESSTLVGYKSKFRCHIEPSVVGHTRIGEVTGSQLSLYYQALVDHGHIKSVRKVAALISRTFGQAVLWPELGLTANPARGAIIPTRRDGDEERSPEQEIVGEFIERARTEAPAMVTALRVLAFMGPRRGELVALRLSDLEVEGEDTYLHIRHALIHLSAAEQLAGVRPKSNYVQLTDKLWVKDTKGHADRRGLIDTDTAAALGRHLEWLEVRAVLAGVEMIADPFLFSDLPDCSIPWEPDHLTGQWLKLCKTVGHDVRLHDLRHFFGTQLGSAGVSLKGIMKRMGHKQQATALRYLKLTPQEDRKVADTMGAIARRLQASQ